MKVTCRIFLSNRTCCINKMTDEQQFKYGFLFKEKLTSGFMSAIWRRNWYGSPRTSACSLASLICYKYQAATKHSCIRFKGLKPNGGRASTTKTASLVWWGCQKKCMYFFSKLQVLYRTFTDLNSRVQNAKWQKLPTAHGALYSVLYWANVYYVGGSREPPNPVSA